MDQEVGVEVGEKKVIPIDDDGGVLVVKAFAGVSPDELAIVLGAGENEAYRWQSSRFKRPKLDEPTPLLPGWTMVGMNHDGVESFERIEIKAGVVTTFRARKLSSTGVEHLQADVGPVLFYDLDRVESLGGAERTSPSTHGAYVRDPTGPLAKVFDKGVTVVAGDYRLSFRSESGQRFGAITPIDAPVGASGGVFAIPEVRTRVVAKYVDKAELPDPPKEACLVAPNVRFIADKIDLARPGRSFNASVGVELGAKPVTALVPLSSDEGIVAVSVSGFLVPLAATPGGTVTVPIHRLDVEDVQVELTPGVKTHVAGTYTVERAINASQWTPQLTEGNWSGDRCESTLALGASWPTNSGQWLPAGHYRVVVSYTSRAPATKVYEVDLP